MQDFRVDAQAFDRLSLSSLTSGRFRNIPGTKRCKA
ncbi:hypothetical protein PMI06_004850 [Burkholderia sp. BT03]|nr:hypothetical protein PMI06_004850 [Burkholderia sp. BT03]SKC77668.1 hypothetical protein SAMN06266956_3127 [Paraburkholderia hospita]